MVSSHQQQGDVHHTNGRKREADGSKHRDRNLLKLAERGVHLGNDGMRKLHHFNILFIQTARMKGFVGAYHSWTFRIGTVVVERK